MRKPAYSALVEKSQAACVAAIETYNRAACEYREENFAILMINAWELLLKARVMQANGGKVKSLYEFVPHKKKDGTPGKHKKVRETRSGLPYTISITTALNLCCGYPKNKVDPSCKANIESLIEIRDSATHFVVKSARLNKALAELSLAAVSNYVIAAQEWFGLSFSHLNIASIPLSLDPTPKALVAIPPKEPASIAAFLNYVSAGEAKAAAMTSPFLYTVQVNFDLVKSKNGVPLKATIVGPGDNPDVTVAIDPNKLPDGFDWSHGDLCKALRKRYSDFKQNSTFNGQMQKLQDNTKYCHTRYLDPYDHRYPRRFYNPNIVMEFDKKYTKK